MNIEHLGRFERGLVFPGMNAVHRTHINAGRILRADARFTDDIGHEILNVLMILKKELGVFFAAAACVLATLRLPAATPLDTASRACDSALAALFTPKRPLMGRYEVCVDPRGVNELEPTWPVELLESGDAFGAAGSADRAALTRLFRGRRAQVARGWTSRRDGIESITLISPYPNAGLMRLEPGTLVIRWICDAGGGCKMPDRR